MPSSSWCNWWKCAKNHVSVAALVWLILTLWYRVSSALAHNPSFTCSSFSAILGWELPSCRRALLQRRSTNSRMPFYIFLCVCVCVCSEDLRLAACLLFMHTDGKKCSGFIALHAGCLTSHTKRRQHSSCYRYANVRVVMVAAQPEISSPYLWSAEHVWLPPQNTLTHPHSDDLCSHTSDTGIALLSLIRHGLVHKIHYVKAYCTDLYGNRTFRS